MISSQDSPIPEYIVSTTQYYKKSARRYRDAYFIVKALQLSVTLSVTVVSFIPGVNIRNHSQLIVGVLGATLLALEGIQQTLQLQPLWVKYRATANVLQRELLLYRGGAGPYASQNIDTTSASRLFVERAEAVIASENSDWTSLQEKVMAEQSKLTH
jgi:Protein of unknown function (DUF4231)